MKVSEIMTVAPRTCTPDTTLAAAANLMWESDCGVLPVVDDGDLVGIVTDRDMLLALGTLNARAIHLRVGAVATTRVATCGPDDEVAGALETMKRARVRRLPVVDTNGQLVGIISISDIALAAHQDGPVRSADVMDTLRAIWARRHQTANRNAA
jgi:CBS domain-containing protein